jgi:hypothetical protein
MYWCSTGNHRDVEPDHRAGLAGEVAGGAHHVLAGDVAFVGPDQPLAGRLLLDPDHARLTVDFGAAGARAPGQRLGQIGRLDVAVLGMTDRADEPLDVAERPDLLHLLRRQELDLDPYGRGDAGILVILVHPVAVHGETDVGHFGEADALSGLLFQRLVERHRMLMDLADRIAHVEERQEARGVPGRAAGELLPLDQHDIRPALPGKLIEGRDPDRAAADHHHARLALHRPPPAGIPRAPP